MTTTVLSMDGDESILDPAAEAEWQILRRQIEFGLRLLARVHLLPVSAPGRGVAAPGRTNLPASGCGPMTTRIPCGSTSASWTLSRANTGTSRRPADVRAGEAAMAPVSARPPPPRRPRPPGGRASPSSGGYDPRVGFALTDKSSFARGVPGSGVSLTDTGFPPAFSVCGREARVPGAAVSGGTALPGCRAMQREGVAQGRFEASVLERWPCRKGEPKPWNSARICSRTSVTTT